jgi:hypothetical protein
MGEGIFRFYKRNGFINSFGHTDSKIIDCRINRIFFKDAWPIVILEGIIKQQIISLTVIAPKS